MEKDEVMKVFHHEFNSESATETAKKERTDEIFFNIVDIELQYIFCNF